MNKYVNRCMKKMLIPALTLMFGLSAAACGTAKSDSVSETSAVSGSSQSSASDKVLSSSSEASGITADTVIDSDELFSYLNYITDDPVSVKSGDDYTFSYSYGPDADAEEYVELFSFTVERTGRYVVTLSGLDRNTVICNAAMDDNSSILLELYNVDTENGNKLTGESEMTGEMDLIAGRTYYSALLAMAPDSQDSVSGSAVLKIEDKGDIEAAEEIKAGGSITTTVDSERLQIAAFTPEETGYYKFRACMESEDTDSTAVVYSIQKDYENDENIADGICYLEKENTYYVVYGADGLIGQEEELSLECIAIDSAEMAEAEGQIEISNHTFISYTAQEDGEYLVYSVSDGNPDAYVYDADLNMIAENQNADGLLSDNEKDFALLMSVEKGKQYWICVQDNDGEKCTVHVEKYDPEN